MGYTVAAKAVGYALPRVQADWDELHSFAATFKLYVTQTYLQLSCLLYSIQKIRGQLRDYQNKVTYFGAANQACD